MPNGWVKSPWHHNLDTCPNLQLRMFEDPPTPQHTVRENILTPGTYISMALGVSRVQELALCGGLKPFVY